MSFLYIHNLSAKPRTLRKDKIPSRPARIFILFHLFSYLRTNTKIGWEAGRGVYPTHIYEIPFLIGMIPC